MTPLGIRPGLEGRHLWAAEREGHWVIDFVQGWEPFWLRTWATPCNIYLAQVNTSWMTPEGRRTNMAGPQGVAPSIGTQVISSAAGSSHCCQTTENCRHHVTSGSFLKLLYKQTHHHRGDVVNISIWLNILITYHHHHNKIPRWHAKTSQKLQFLRWEKLDLNSACLGNTEFNLDLCVWTRTRTWNSLDQEMAGWNVTLCIANTAGDWTVGWRFSKVAWLDSEASKEPVYW